MKRVRENKGRQDDEGRRARVGRAGRTLSPDMDRLSGLLPDPKRLSPVYRSALARKGPGALSFARALARVRGRLPGTNPLAFVQALLQGRFTNAEGDARAWEKVYRKLAAKAFVSETRLSLSVRTALDLKVLSLTASLAGHVGTNEVLTRTREVVTNEVVTKRKAVAAKTKETAAAGTLLPPSTVRVWPEAAPARRGASFDQRSYQTISPAFVSVLERRTHRAAPRTLPPPAAAARPRVVAELTTPSGWDVPPPSDEKVPPAFNYTNAPSGGVSPRPALDEKLPHAFNYINALGPNVEYTSRFVSAHHVIHGAASRIEASRMFTEAGRMFIEARRPSAETRRTPRAGARAGLQLTQQNLPRPAGPQEPLRQASASYQLTSLDLRTSHAPRELLSVRFVTPSTKAGNVGARATQIITDRFFSWTQSPGGLRRHLAPEGRASLSQSTEPTRVWLTSQGAPAGIVEIWKERPASGEADRLQESPCVVEIWKERSAATHAAGRVRPRTVSRGALVSVAAGGTAAATLTNAGAWAAFNSSRPDEHRPIQSLQHLRMLRVTRDVREFLVPSGVGGARAAGYTSAGSADASRVDTLTQACVSHAFSPTFIVRPGFVRESSTRRTAHTTASTQATTHNLFRASSATSNLFGTSSAASEALGLAARPLVAPWLQHAAPPPGPSVETLRDSASGVYGARALLFSSRPTGPSAGTAAARAGSAMAAPLVSFRPAFSSSREVGDERGTPSGWPAPAARELIRQRREEVLRLPPLGYVYTQPPRPAVEEQRVFAKASEREIVEVVRREMSAVSASGQKAQSALSRADFAGLADEVYSTLVRRLLVEKERLGLFS